MNRVFKYLNFFPLLLVVITSSILLASNANRSETGFFHDHAFFKLESLIFKNTTTWTFWLNGIRMDSGSYDKSFFLTKGFRLLDVKEDGVLLSSLKEPEIILFLKPKMASEKTIKPAPKKKTSGEEIEKRRKINEGSLGF